MCISFYFNNTESASLRLLSTIHCSLKVQQMNYLVNTNNVLASVKTKNFRYLTYTSITRQGRFPILPPSPREMIAGALQYLSIYMNTAITIFIMGLDLVFTYSP